MKMQNQTEALKTLSILADHKQHGVIISGPHGSGKTYLSKEYSKLLHIPDYMLVNPSMADVKTIIQMCTEATNDIVLCIENLDAGVLSVSYPLLKFIEDCPKNLYVVVTCINIRQIPDTILSRCALVSINNPVSSDIAQYAQAQNTAAYEWLKDTMVWKCVRNFADADTILKLNVEQFKYIESLKDLLAFKSSVSSISWKLQNYEDKSPTPIKFVIYYLMSMMTTHHGKRSCLQCLDALDTNRMSQNAIITKFVFENKYIG